MEEKRKHIPLTKNELFLIMANGDSSDKSTQAARRICIKRGLDWTEYVNPRDEKEVA